MVAHRTDGPTDEGIGASAAAIRSHYDAGNDFYALWLDPTLTYSAALWDEPDLSLEEAQLRKLDFHVAAAGAAGARRVLDVGCGWGSLLERLTRAHGVERAVGLTLSEAQVAWVAARANPRVEVRLESWVDHAPAEPYDAIVTIGALEHFARPEDDRKRKVESYRRFFEHCRALLVPGGRLSLQTIAFGIGRYVPGTPVSRIFPESHLPRLDEIAAAADGVFEIERLRNDRSDYERTLTCWIERLRARRADAVRIAGEERTAAYEEYLAFARWGFEQGVFVLLRITMRALPLRRR